MDLVFIFLIPTFNIRSIGSEISLFFLFFYEFILIS